MPKVSKKMFYAVHAGHQPGVYETWADCEQQVKGFPKARYKKFSTRVEADTFVRLGAASSSTATIAGLAPITNPSGEVEKTKYMRKKLGKQKAEEVIDESGWDVVYTDGACQGNGHRGAIAGIGVWWGANDPRNLAERCPGSQTNNRAELIAIIRVLETTSKSIKRLLIKTDSSYSISCVRDWMPTWRKRGWKTIDGKDVKNKPLIVYLSHLLDQRGQSGQIIQLQHVRGHKGIIGNEGADNLAGIGSSLPPISDRDWSVSHEESNMPELQARS